MTGDGGHTLSHVRPKAPSVDIRNYRSIFINTVRLVCKKVEPDSHSILATVHFLTKWYIASPADGHSQTPSSIALLCRWCTGKTS
jgi:hypothetical protein